MPGHHRTDVVDGGTVSEVDRCAAWAVYVPGGNAVYPSSVIMNVVPPRRPASGRWWWPHPQKDFGGWPHPTILAACSLLGVDEVWAVGGAQVWRCSPMAVSTPPVRCSTQSI